MSPSQPDSVLLLSQQDTQLSASSLCRRLLLFSSCSLAPLSSPLFSSPLLSLSLSLSLFLLDESLAAERGFALLA
jgi:hypothetical protein